MSQAPQPGPRPFDEKAALAELERLAAKIQSSRRQRAQVEAEFERFVRGFREQRLAAGGASPQTESVPRSVPPPSRERATPERPPARPPVPAVEASSASPLASESWPIPEKLERGPQRSRGIRGVGSWVGLAAVGAAIVLVLIWQPWRDAAPPPATPVPRAGPPPAAEAPAQAAQTTPPPAPIPARALNVELITSRRVWTRVTVDGQRVIEREVAADQRIQIAADRSIAIRAGDAGAVRLIVDGKDLGVLGADGQIGTRTLTAK